MSSSDSLTSPPVESFDQLLGYFTDAYTPRDQWRLGTEHELIAVSTRAESLGHAPPYEGEAGIGAVLAAICGEGWEPVREGDTVIGLVRDDAQVTLEPGGQLELAARPVRHADDARDDLYEFIRRLDAPSRDMGLAWLDTGFRPFGTLDSVPWMPKGRYAIMRDYLPTRGSLAHEMMKRTATVQVSIDFGDMGDAASKLRCCLSITSLLTAIYANSPIVDGKPSGYQTYRSRVWRDTDPDRCGLLPFAFDDGDVFQAYTTWALDVPMFFIKRGDYIPASAVTFRQFMAEGFQGHQATMDDWTLHLSTVFPEARLKSLLEVRGCDSSRLSMVTALGPFCRGVFYDDTARAEATKLTEGLSLDDRYALWESVARDGLRAVLPDGRLVVELARELVRIADDGLSREAPDERGYLDPLREIVTSGRTQADEMLELWERTGGDVLDVVAGIAHET